MLGNIRTEALMKDKLGSLAIIVLASELSFSSCFGVLIQSRNKKLKIAFYLFIVVITADRC